MANTGAVEFVMSDTLVPLAAMLRNVGGQPATNRTVTMEIGWQSPQNAAQFTSVSTQMRQANVDVASGTSVSFGTFMPRTLKELGLTDAFYGNNPNVTPVYRIRVTSQTDELRTNDTATKLVRFYVQRSAREAMVSVENYQPDVTAPVGLNAVQLSNKLNTDTLIAALRAINWDRADSLGREDYDLFERDKWPVTNLNFTPWTTMIWSQGSETQGLEPEERAALKEMLTRGTMNLRNTLVIAGQDVARIHDVALNAGNGMVADQEFVNTYLRAQRSPLNAQQTVPADYSTANNVTPFDINRGGRIRGVQINPGRFEELERTRVAADAVPMPTPLRVTPGAGIAQPA